ncbi:6-phosphogluconate dehydrogenase, partial [Propionibacterium freudenreichii]|nr:6-phosphogluconate dehydrogenase [Propionibacterium freudenreichii]
MQLGLIGLGRMGRNMAERISRAGHDVIGYDRDPQVSQVADLPALVDALELPRVVWVMVPAGAATRAVIAELAGLLAPGDMV